MKLEDLTHEQREKLSEFGVNTWFVMELLENYLNNPASVAEDWQTLFASLNINGAGNGHSQVQSSTYPLDKKPGAVNTAGTGKDSAQLNKVTAPAVNMPQPQAGGSSCDQGCW